MEKLIKSARDGSSEAMMELVSRACKSRRVHQAFFCVMEKNLKFNTTSIQDMKRGRVPLVPSLDPKDALNLSCTSMLALATAMQHKYLLQPGCLVETTSSVIPLSHALSFWVSLFCEHIILPSRTLEFKSADFHKTVVLTLARVPDRDELDPKFFTDYLPYLWFHPPAGYTKYNFDDARAVFTAFPSSTRGKQYANLIVQFIADVFAHAPNESDVKFQIYQCLLTVASSTFQLASGSVPIHTALLKSNSIQWMSRILRFTTRRARFTSVVLRVATECLSECLLYVLRVMEDGHSYIARFLGCDILRYLLKACRNLHAHPELMDRELKVLQVSMENHAVKILKMVISHFVYPSILKRSQKAISKVERQHIDDFIGPDPFRLTGICETWNEFINIAAYKADIFGKLSYSFCGNVQCPGTTARKCMVCSRCLFTLYCSQTCQKDDWLFGNHRSLCVEAKQLAIDNSPLPMSFSDRRAIEDLNSRYVEYYKHKSPSPDPDEDFDVLREYIAENGEPDPHWPLIWILDHSAVNVEPDIDVTSSERHVEDIDPEMLAEAREGAGTMVYWTIPDGRETITELELIAS
ncbi:hypothetical protein EDD18DRAFT_1465036 [Armillaria luteobubalina]|uniref:MYND-type domain-containing protein n=1 Tax=Armillaria luteobubalina TaxID=153913 RepID=A0AA39PZS4_9AGAR|nr:hypothetical protein EDD18DRAFT_1465036 [Armillaria luteobubalina]